MKHIEYSGASGEARFVTPTVGRLIAHIAASEVKAQAAREQGDYQTEAHWNLVVGYLEGFLKVNEEVLP